MTEKQFYYAHGAVWCTKKPNGLNAISINDLDNGLRVANWLNELNDENEQLKAKNYGLEKDLQETMNIFKEFEKENEKLNSKNRGLQSELQIFKEDVTHSNLQINKLADENEYLKLLSNYRGEMVSFATSLIQDMGSEEMLKMWNDFTEVMYQKWKKKRGIK